MKSHVPVFVDHIAFGMPVLIHAIPEDLDELLQDCRLAAIAPLRKARRVVVVAIHTAFMLVVGILSAEDCGTDGAGEVLDVILSVQPKGVGGFFVAGWCRAAAGGCEWDVWWTCHGSQYGCMRDAAAEVNWPPKTSLVVVACFEAAMCLSVAGTCSEASNLEFRNLNGLDAGLLKCQRSSRR